MKKNILKYCCLFAMLIAFTLISCKSHKINYNCSDIVIDKSHCNTILLTIPDSINNITFIDSIVVLKLSNEETAKIKPYLFYKPEIMLDSNSIYIHYFYYPLKRFSMDGKYLNGYGSNEYPDRFDITNNKVIIQEGMNMSFYSLSGQLIKTDSLFCYTNNFICKSPNEFIIYPPDSKLSTDEIIKYKKYRLLITDSTFKNGEALFDRNKDHFDIQFYKDPNNNIYLYNYYCDSIYRLNNDNTIQCLYRYKYENDSITHHDMEDNSMVFLKDKLFYRCKLDKYDDDINYLNIYSIKRGKSVSAMFKYPSISEYLFFNPENVVYAFDNVLISYFYPSEFTDNKKNIEKNRSEFVKAIGEKNVSLIESFDEDDNMCLVFTYIKDF